MWRDELYLRDIVQAASDIRAFIADQSLETLLDDEIIRSAILWKLTVIGEAASQLSKAFKLRHAEVDWGVTIGFRNRAIHGYFSIDWTVVWETAVLDVPDLERQIVEILNQEYPSTDAEDG